MVIIARRVTRQDLLGDPAAAASTIAYDDELLDQLGRVRGHDVTPVERDQTRMGAVTAVPPCRVRPDGSPATLEAEQGELRDERKSRKAEEAGLVAAGDLLGEAEGRSEIEAAEAAHGAHDTGNHADLSAEALGRQLEDRAIASPQRHHRDQQHGERHPRYAQVEAGGGKGDGGDAVDNRQRVGPPSLSASVPPTGRRSEPANTQPAVKKPAITGSR